MLGQLADAGVRLDRGLTEVDLKRIEKKFGFAFAPDHRALLRTALPVGDSWLNWRQATDVKIRERLRAPVEGVVLAVRDGAFWLPAWGPRPEDDDDNEEDDRANRDGRAAKSAARQRLASVPALVPVFSDHYLPAAPAPAGCFVFSVRGAEVVVHGRDLLDFVTAEFGLRPAFNGSTSGRPRIDFWSDLASGDA